MLNFGRAVLRTKYLNACRNCGLAHLELLVLNDLHGLVEQRAVRHPVDGHVALIPVVGAEARLLVERAGALQAAVEDVLGLAAALVRHYLEVGVGHGRIYKAICLKLFKYRCSLVWHIPQ